VSPTLEQFKQLRDCEPGDIARVGSDGPFLILNYEITEGWRVGYLGTGIVEFLWWSDVGQVEIMHWIVR